jgi:hypothetical protein
MLNLSDDDDSHSHDQYTANNQGDEVQHLFLERCQTALWCTGQFRNLQASLAQKADSPAEPIQRAAQRVYSVQVPSISV